MSLIDIIKEKQDKGETLRISFKDNTLLYIETDSIVEVVDEDFYHFKAEVSQSGKIDTIRNIREIRSIDPLDSAKN